MNTNYSAKKEATLRSYWPVAAALIIGLGASAGLSMLLWRNAQQADQNRFNMLTHLVRALFDDKVEKYEQVLGMMREFFNHEELPTQMAWQQLLNRVKPGSHYQSLLEEGYGSLQTGAQLMHPSPALLEAMATNCVLSPNLLSNETYLTLLYAKVQPPLNAYNTGLGPLDQPRLARTLRVTMSESSYRNSFSVSRRMSLGLGGAPTNIYGFYMARAVFDPSLPLETPLRPNEMEFNFFDRLTKERAPHFRGCVIGAIDVDRLLLEALKDTVLEIAFEIFDGPKPSESQRLNDHIALPTPEDRVRRLDLTNRVSIWPKYTRRWAIVSYPTAEFDMHSPRRIAWIALASGIATTLCITGLVWMQTRQRLTAEIHAAQMSVARDVIDSLSREQEQTSRDLHDGVLQSLYALGLGLQKSRKLITRDPAQAEEACRQNVATLELAMGEVRRHLGKGSPAEPEDLDLHFALRHLAEVMTLQDRVPVSFERDPMADSLPIPAIALQMLQIAREAISNAQRHSGASLVRVCLSGGDGVLAMTIADDGCGFDPENLPPQGYGLKNMADRASQIGAEYQLLTRPGEGVRLMVSLTGGGWQAGKPGEREDGARNKGKKPKTDA
jgi:signal transduction histidine kinase